MYIIGWQQIPGHDVQCATVRLIELMTVRSWIFTVFSQKYLNTNESLF